jgi:hypothetical protein
MVSCQFRSYRIVGPWMFSVPRTGCSQFMLLQTPPKCILRLGGIYVRHLGETSNVDAWRPKNGTPHHTGSLSIIHVKKRAA